MSENNNKDKTLSSYEAELYLLIAKFLKTGPCKKSAEILRHEIEQHELMPKRLDWLGNEHRRSYEDIDESCPHIANDYLLKICARIGPILDKEVTSNITGVKSLLSAGYQSLLRSKEELLRPKFTSASLIVRRHGYPPFPSKEVLHNYPPNITQVLVAREISGPSSRMHSFPYRLYSRKQMYRRLLGHLSSVYCVLFDRSGKYIITGADDLLVKIWSASDGRLLATLRGHSAEITDMAVNYENTLLAAGSCNKLIRVWCLRTIAPLAVLVGHTGMVTSLQFCPYPKGEQRYLISTGNDGCVCFWQWNIKTNEFNPKPLKFTDRNRAGAQMICSSFSSGGIFLATGSTDHHVRVYNILGNNGPEKILEMESHSDRVDSLQFSNIGCRFISGSKDGTALIWRYERQHWHTITLRMTTKLEGKPTDEIDDNKQKLRVTMVGWNTDDSVVITAVNDSSLKVWDSYTGKLKHVLIAHEDEVFVLEPHPTDPRVLLSGGHDGRIVLWDLTLGTVIKSFFNVIEGQGHGAVFDCKFSPDGFIFASTDSHGHLSIFGYGSNDNYKKVPDEQFFHTDYRPLIRDANHHVLDEQTQCAPHLMPPPFLVDIDGNPYPPNLQRLVPGRENCNDSQLIPYIAVSANGEAEILEPVRQVEVVDPHRPTIDDMIERLQHEQAAAGSAEAGERSGQEPFSPRSRSAQQGHRLVGMRNDGDIEGVRQSSGNWQSRGNSSEMPTWTKRVVVKPLSSAMMAYQYHRRTVLSDAELAHYLREKKRRPITVVKENHSNETENRIERRKQRMNKQQSSLQTRATRENRRNAVYGDRYENPVAIHISTSNTSDTDINCDPWEDSSRDSESGSGEDSDWTADAGLNVKSRQTNKTKRVARRQVSNSEEEDEEENEEHEEQNENHHRREKTRKTRRKLIPGGIKEIPNEFRPPEWLTDVVPHKVPYVPQIGDDDIYFRQGHENYIEAVKKAKIYEIDTKNLPWKKLKLREQEVVKIVDINYEIRPPRLCCLKLLLVNPSDRSGGDTFTIRYHDMPDVIDFLVLKQNYDQAIQRNWKPGMPSVMGGSVDITPEERLAMMYSPKDNEWSPRGQVAECNRLIRGLEKIMELSCAESFISPVDLNKYPMYAFVVEYPMDLSTIKARLENHYYRRIQAVKFDVGFIETNAKKFNEPSSRIVQDARIVCELLLHFIDAQNCEDPMEIYQEMMEARQFNESDATSDSYISDTDEEHINQNNDRKRKMNVHRANKRRRLESSQVYTSRSWKQQCTDLLDVIFQCEDSTPFRNPVDLNEYPNYRDIIDNPTDLGKIRENLLADHYDSPVKFCKDMRLLFQNSRNYNTNKKSRIYSMTIRLSAMFEEHIRGIISDWRSAVKYEEKLRNNQYVSHRRRPFAQVRTDIVPSLSSSRALNRPSTSGTSSRSSTSNMSQPSTSYSLRNGDISRPSTSRNYTSCTESKNKSSQAKTNGTGPRKKERIIKSDEEDGDNSRSSSGGATKKLNTRSKYKSGVTNGEIKTRKIVTRSHPKRVKPIRHSSEEETVPRRRTRQDSRLREEANHMDSETEISSNVDKEDSEEELRPQRTRLRRRCRIVNSVRKPEPEIVLRPRRTRLRAVISEPSEESESEEKTSSNSSEEKDNRVDESENDSSNDNSKQNTSSDDDSSDSNTEQTSNLSEEENDDEEDEEEDDDDAPVRRSSRTATRNCTRATRSALHTRHADAPSRLSSRMQTRSRGQRTVRYREESDGEPESDNTIGSEAREVLSVSSRGRRRKLTRHVRALFYD
ncbi:PH-interacting protein-like isoform X2 [Centruroides sculpturatus]|uniref:PH-interacting protein-like isoform X2 n=1 Tax=Centruroides sculpturatus TaxID=218467 RepID=UPI000C6D4C90|nr:PH-interacting protein-like isoform X2 [Centruroides sculpturatus]